LSESKSLATPWPICQPGWQDEERGRGEGETRRGGDKQRRAALDVCARFRPHVYFQEFIIVPESKDVKSFAAG